MTVTQLKEKTVFEEEHKQNKLLKDIFKHAYFYSTSKGKTFNEKYEKINTEGAEERHLKNIQKNMTFLNYVGKRNWKRNFNKGKVRGNNLFKNQESILQLEREGSPQQLSLIHI